MASMTVTITAEIEMYSEIFSDEDLLWCALARLTERDALSRYPITIDREEH